MESPSIMLMIRWKRCESQSVISINIRPRTHEVCFDLTKIEGYTQQMLNCLSLHSDSGTNGMLGYSDKSIEKHGKKREKKFQKNCPRNPEPQLVDCNPYFEYLGKNNVKKFFVRRLYTFWKHCFSWKVATAEEIDMPFSSQFNPL